MHKSIVLISLLAFSSGPAFGDCSRATTIKKEFLRSDLVFLGKVISAEVVHPGPNGFSDGTNYQLSVIEQFRGKPEKIITIFSENSSGRFPMVVGKSYLLFSTLEPDTWAGLSYEVYNCGHSGEAQLKQKTIAIVRKLGNVKK